MGKFDTFPSCMYDKSKSIKTFCKTLCQAIPSFNNTERKKTLENIVGKGDYRYAGDNPSCIFTNKFYH